LIHEIVEAGVERIVAVVRDVARRALLAVGEATYQQGIQEGAARAAWLLTAYTHTQDRCTRAADGSCPIPLALDVVHDARAVRPELTDDEILVALRAMKLPVRE
jgi:hypothetical protein